MSAYERGLESAWLDDPEMGTRERVEAIVGSFLAEQPREWICQYPEFGDPNCLTDHNPAGSWQPRKHADCGWFITVAVNDTAPPAEGGKG